MRLSKTLAYAVYFGAWCNLHDIACSDAAELVTLARRASKAAERECNDGVSADPARRRFEAKATALGYGVEWNGLYPTLRKGNRDVRLPLD